MLIGGVTFTGSMVAYAKLAEKIDSKPFLFKNQQLINAAVLACWRWAAWSFFLSPHSIIAILFFLLAVALSLVLGVLVTIPIGGADMPVVTPC